MLGGNSSLREQQGTDTATQRSCRYPICRGVQRQVGWGPGKSEALELVDLQGLFQHMLFYDSVKEQFSLDPSLIYHCS